MRTGWTGEDIDMGYILELAPQSKPGTFEDSDFSHEVRRGFKCLH